MPGNHYTSAYAVFIATLRAERKLADLTQAELAERLNQPQSFVSKSERWERRMDVIEFIQIAGALGWEPEQLLEHVRAALKQAQV
jgi:transcriptional regulator with XRE-family HTH domain